MKFQIFKASHSSFSAKMSKKYPPTNYAGASWDESLKTWTIDFQSLDDLIGFVLKEGSVIFDVDEEGPGLTIYDDYVE